jgi:hypothetical protein
MFEIIPVVEFVLRHSGEIDYRNQNTSGHRSLHCVGGWFTASSTPHTSWLPDSASGGNGLGGSPKSADLNFKRGQ